MSGELYLRRNREVDLFIPVFAGTVFLQQMATFFTRDRPDPLTGRVLASSSSKACWRFILFFSARNRTEYIRPLLLKTDQGLHPMHSQHYHSSRPSEMIS